VSRHLVRLLWVALVALSPVTTAKMPASAREVTFDGVGALSLRGTLLLPDQLTGKVPGVLLLPGSGPTDRDGNQRPVVVSDLLKQIAERLAQEGYASLRFDKRAARGYSAVWPTDVAAQNEFFSWEAFVGDAEAALVWLQAQPEIDATHVVVAGHSEGSMIAMQIGHDLEGKAGAPAGLILMSAPGRPGGEILLEQVAANLTRAGLAADQVRPYTDYVTRALSQIDKDGTVPPNPPVGLGGVFPASALKLVGVEMRFDPTKTLPGYRGRVLVVQGEKDIQISATRDTPPLVAALQARPQGTCDVVMVPSASHNLKRVDNENIDPGVAGPVVPAALDAIASWIRKNVP
jgi:pimeloyl-ACP methyl ester carboxylesterase